ncbi:MAG: sulfatase-like hydrolase/transferase, partial [Pseudomonadota bacterium]
MPARKLFSLTPIVAAVLMSCTTEDRNDSPNVIVIFTDDQGYADLGANGVVSDIATPHLDALANDGVRMTSGYVTAPQCTPSRAALMTGRYQQKFNLDDNSLTPMTLDQPTMADRLQDAGYQTGIAGKWHLDIDQNSRDFDVSNTPLTVRQEYFPDARGFDDVYVGYRNTWWTNFDIDGRTLNVGYRRNEDYRLDVTTDAGLTFIDRHHDKPFFLYLPYFAPHVPMEATEEYLSRHESAPETRRRYALAMMSAIDDGVGAIRQKLEDHNLTDNTLLFFISDNGAPLGIDLRDAPIEDNGAAWDGSLNTPWVGEKGMLTEGGIRVPYVVTWPGTLPANTVIDTPVSTLDVAATALELANADTSDLD